MKPAIHLRAASQEDLPFLLTLRRLTMTEHLQRVGDRHQREHDLARVTRGDSTPLHYRYCVIFASFSRLPIICALAFSAAIACNCC